MDLKDATARIASQKELVIRIRDEVSRVIVGQEKLVDRLLLALVTDGHILLEGVPGQDTFLQYARQGPWR